MFTLYTTPLSANGRKVLAVSHHLGLQPELRFINVYRGEGRAPEYLAINPFGKIPALVDGDLKLWESNAILQYLAEAYGDCRLWSRDVRRRADISRWLFWEASQWQPALVPLLSERVGRLLFPRPGAPPPAPVDWVSGQVGPLLGHLESHLGEQPYLAGDELTIADFSVAGMMTYARAGELPFAVFPNVAAWYARMEALPAWRQSAAGPWRYDQTP